MPAITRPTTRTSRPGGLPRLDAAAMRRVAAFIDGPGRMIVLFVVVLMFVKIFVN